MTSSCNTNFKAELPSRITHPRVYPPNTRCFYLLRTNLSIRLVRRQAIAWPHTDLLTILHLETNFSEIGIKMQNIFFFKKMYWKILFVTKRPLCSWTPPYPYSCGVPVMKYRAPPMMFDRNVAQFPLTNTSSTSPPCGLRRHYHRRPREGCVPGMLHICYTVGNSHLWFYSIVYL